MSSSLSLTALRKKKPSVSKFGGMRRSNSFTGNFMHRVNDVPYRTTVPLVSPFDLCNGLKDRLPLRLTVAQGTYGINPMTTFVGDEEVTAHFVQSLEHVSFRAKDGQILLIPIDSSVSASTIYDPTDNLEKGFNGYVFPTPRQIMMQSTHPKFVTVLKEHVEDDPSFTVEANDVLFVVGPTKSGRKRDLKCIHVASGLTKFIREECKVRLSTRPEHVSVPLKTLLQYISLPVKALVSLSGCVAETRDRSIFGVVLERKTFSTLLIARTIEGSNSEQTFALPDSFNLDLQQISPISKKEDEALCFKSAKYLQDFDSRDVCYDNLCSLNVDYCDTQHRQIQLAFYRSILNENKKGIDCPRLRKHFPLKQFAASKLSNPAVISIETRVALLEETMQALLSEIKLLGEKVDKNILKANDAVSNQQSYELAQVAFDTAINLQKVVSDLQRNEDEKTRSELNLLSKSSKSEGVTTMAMDDGDYQPLIPPRAIQVPPATMIRSPTGSTVDGFQTISSINKHYLETLTVQQVEEVLEKLNMNEYVQKFRKENIDGKKMAGLKKRELSLNFKITNETHRNKLLELITGELSVFPLITM